MNHSHESWSLVNLIISTRPLLLTSLPDIFTAHPERRVRSAGTLFTRIFDLKWLGFFGLVSEALALKLVIFHNKGVMRGTVCTGPPDH